MLQLWLIAVLAIVYIHDELGGRLADPIPFSVVGFAGMLAPYLALAAIVQCVCMAAARQMDKRGSFRAVTMAERVLSVSRGAAVMTHAACVFSGGWVERVRGVVGADRVLLAEFLAIVPPVLAIVAGWWSFYPIERRLRESMWVRVLDDGHPAYPMPSRVQFVWSNVRHQVFFILVPLMIIGAWGHAWRDVVDRPGSGVLGDFGRWVRASAFREIIRECGQLLGVLGVLAISPLLMRLVWDAVPLGPGRLRDRLMGVCERAGVRVRELLVWRTHGTMINGAAMGLVAPLRYILLTDALLDQLPERQVESVMGHEVGHAKHHHIPWMVGALVSTMGLAMLGLAVVLGALTLTAQIVFGATFSPRMPFGPMTDVVEGVGSLVTLGLGIMTFGWISRSFEWQADAFAAKSLSREDPAAATVTQEAAESMAGALESVARLNHIPRERRGFRHGSIADRQRRLHRLIGVPLERLPIDRTCRWVKGGIVAGLFVIVLAVGSLSVLRAVVEERMAHESQRLPGWWSTAESRLEDAP